MRFNVASSALEALTHSRSDVIGYAQSDDGDTIVYIAKAEWRSIWNDATRDAAYPVTGNEILADLLTSRDGYFFRGLEEEGTLHVSVRGVDRDLPLEHHIARQFIRPSISPDGRYIAIVARLPADRVPQLWRRYNSPEVAFEFRFASRPGYFQSEFRSVEIVDLQTGKAKRLLDAPAGFNARLVWIRGGAALALRSLEPLHPSDRLGDSTEKTIEVEVDSGRITTIGRECDEPYRWNSKLMTLDCLEVTRKSHGKGHWTETALRSRPLEAGHKTFTRTDDRWEETKPNREFEARPLLYARENFRIPPRVMAIDRRTGREHTVLDLNPQLKNIALARVEEINWVMDDGKMFRGGLYFPINFEKDKRYPLVIQTHGWYSDRFQFSGFIGAGYIAQPLASRGFFVLQVDDDDYSITDGTKDIDRAIGIYKCAISKLVGARYIDPRRVGIIGWSHTDWYVKYALTHTKLFAAAALGEGEDGGYIQYLGGMNNYVDADALYGGPPYGANLSAWISRAPNFNLDKIDAPLRIVVHNPRFLLMDWETFSGLLDLHKPVDMVMFADGDHFLHRPNQAASASEGNLDWFEFWLNDHEDPDPKKSELYRRWRQLRQARRDNGSATQ
jgi:dipeptidyl aminopeptidase/acylaminoacyl peptidase